MSARIKAKELTTEQLRKLAEVHINRYNKMIESGHPAVRVDECQHLIAVWRSANLGGPLCLSFSAEVEVQDAIDSGSYDELLGIKKTVLKLSGNKTVIQSDPEMFV